MTYQSTGGDIGALLRLIQEDKSSSALASPPAAEVASPIRGTAQGPLLSPEAPGTTRVVSLRPEGAAQGAADPGQGGVVQPGGAAPAPAVVGPSRAPSGPVINAGSIPTGTLLNNAPANRPSSPSINMPSIGTKITSSIGQAKPVNVSANLTNNKTPQRSTNSLIIAKAPQPKNFVGLNPGQNALDKIINSFLKKAPGNVTQKLFPKLFA